MFGRSIWQATSLVTKPAPGATAKTRNIRQPGSTLSREEKNEAKKAAKNITRGKIKSYPRAWTEPTPLDSPEVYAKKLQEYQESPQLQQHYKAQQDFFKQFKAARASTSVVQEWEYAPTMQTFNQIFTDQVTEYEHKDALRQVNEDITWNWKDVQAHTNSTAAGLLESCGHEGASYAMGLPNKVEAWIGLVACTRSQRHPAFLAPPHYYGPKLVDMLANVRPGYFVFAPKVANLVQLECIYETFPMLNGVTFFDVIKHDDLPELRCVLHTGKKPLDGMVPLRSLLVRDPQKDFLSWKRMDKDSDPRVPYIYVWPHPGEPVQEPIHWNEYALLNAGVHVGTKLGLNEHDSVVNNIPPYETAGLAFGWAMTLAFRARFVIPWEVFSPDHTIRTIARDKGTVLVDYASNFKRLLECEVLETEDVSSLRAAVIVGYPDDIPDPQLVREVIDKLDLDRVVITLGSQNVTCLFAEDHENYLAQGGKFGPSSQLPFNRIALLDDNGDVVEMGQEGKFALQGWGSTRYAASLEIQPRPGFASTPIKGVMDKDKLFTALEA